MDAVPPQICNKKLTMNPDERDVRHIELDLGGSVGNLFSLVLMCNY